MIKQLNFSSKGKNYPIGSQDIIIDNGTIVQYVPNGKYARPFEDRITINANEWQRIKPQLMEIDYETYYGRKPLLTGVSIYKLKEATT